MPASSPYSGVDRRVNPDGRRDGEVHTNTANWVTGILTVGMPIILLGLGSISTWIWKVDDRQYQLSSDLPVVYASKAELGKLAQQLDKDFNKRFEMMEQRSRDQRQDREQFQIQVLQEVKETNKNVQDLALKLEKRTRG